MGWGVGFFFFGKREYLATQRAESEGIQKASFADLAGVEDALSRPGLRPFVDEYYSCTVDNVGLHPCYV